MTTKDKIKFCIEQFDKEYTDDEVSVIQKNFPHINIDDIINSDLHNLNDSIIYCLIEHFGADEKILIKNIKIADAVLKEENTKDDEVFLKKSGYGHFSTILPFEPVLDFVPSVVQRYPPRNVKPNFFSKGSRFGFSDSCFINYKFMTRDTVYIDLFKCDTKGGEGRILMNNWLREILTINPSIQYIELTAMPFMSKSDASNRDNIILAQTKLNQYYKDIGFQKISIQNKFRGAINDVLYYTDYYTKNGRGVRRRKRGITKSKKRVKIRSKRRTRRH